MHCCYTSFVVNAICTGRRDDVRAWRLGWRTLHG